MFGWTLVSSGEISLLSTPPPPTVSDPEAFLVQRRLLRLEEELSPAHSAVVFSIAAGNEEKRGKHAVHFGFEYAEEAWHSFDCKQN